VGEEVGDRGGLAEGLVDVGKEVGVEGGEARGKAVPGALDIGIASLNNVG
jgi:hypothetical protein